MKFRSLTLAAASIALPAAMPLFANDGLGAKPGSYRISDTTRLAYPVSVGTSLGDEESLEDSEKQDHGQKYGHGQKHGHSQKHGHGSKHGHDQKHDGDHKGGKGGKGCDSCYLFGPDEAFSISPENDHNITVGGWTQLGYHDKATPLSRFYGNGLSFNDVPGRINLQQQWLYIEKALSGDDCTWDWGFRADFMYGTDAQKTQAFGQPSGWDTDWDNGVYGFAMPQAFLEVGRGPLAIKMGHFYTPIGYEVVTAPDNFFYSHALTMFNSEPFTHTGVLSTYEMTEKLTIYAGWTAGWDTAFESVDGGSNWLGGFSYQVTDDLKFTYQSTAGNFGAIGDQGYQHSIVVDASLTEKLTYVFQQDYQRVESTGLDAVGINQYLLYSLNDCYGVGGRMEWWKRDGNSHYEATLGLNIRPAANLVFRPEIRYDWQPFANFEQATFGVDAILTY